jgi:hypothetical protein
MVGERQGNSMGTAGVRHGNVRGTAWERHGMCESAFMLQVSAVVWKTGGYGSSVSIYIVCICSLSEVRLLHAAVELLRKSGLVLPERRAAQLLAILIGVEIDMS